MNKAKRIIALLLSLVLLTLCCPAVFAASTPTISISNVSADPGKEVTVSISISNNPGIMAMAFCITYDSDVLEYTGYTKGYLSKYTIKDHPDKGHISFVNDESSDKAKNGTMLSVKFKIKDDAAPGKYTITLANSYRDKYGNRLHNSFSNSKQEYIVPNVTAGSVTVNETCENAGHKYGATTVITAATCTTTGVGTHTCVRCDYTEETTIPITHDYESDWTVDQAATPTENGIMSRHCKNCDAVTDTITFTYQEVEDSQNPDDDETSSDENVLNDKNSSENSTSTDNGSSENSSASSNTSESNSATKTPINNTVGAKNPLSSIKNTKDYQENIKSSINENDTFSSTQETTDSSENSSIDNSSDVTSSEITSDSTDYNSDTDDNTDTDITDSNNGWTTSSIVISVVGGVISIAAIAFAIILIIRRKKEDN